LLVGAAGFGGASLLAAFAPSAAVLIAARALLGIAGATLMPSTLALIRVMFEDPKQRTTAIGVWTASFALGGVLAPVIAGVLLAHFWWGSVFLVAVPVMATLLALGRVLLPESRDPAAGRVDPAGAALSLGGMLAAVYGFKRGDLAGALSLAAGLGLLAGFVWRQRRDPWVDPALFRRRLFTVPLAINTCSFFVLYGTQFLIAQYLQLALGLSALEAGLWTIPSALAYLAGSMLAPIAARRASARWTLTASLVLTAAGFGLLTQAGGLTVIVPATVISALGLAPVYVLTTELTVAAAPPERSGSASGILETGANLGGALGITVLGGIAGAVFRDTAPGAQQTLGEALTAASRLPEPAASRFADAARNAFTAGFQSAELAGSALLFAVAVACTLLLGPSMRHPGRNRQARARAASTGPARRRL
jgi:DHA2 family multidrug resistance protein-like MFS transporter